MEEKEQLYKKFKIDTKFILYLAVILVLLILSWKLIVSDIQFDLSLIDIQFITSILIAFFAISMSLAFYFKSTDVSNKFYDRMFNFTKETSTILGRMEERFGERLKHLDEFNTKFQDKMIDKFYNIEGEKEKIEEGKEDIKKKEEDRDRMLEELANRAQLAESDKENLIKSFKEKEAELEDAKIQLRRLQRKVDRFRPYSDKDTSRKLPIRLEIYIKQEIMNCINEYGPNIPLDRIIAQFIDHLSIFSDDEQLISDLKSYGVIDDNRSITNTGFDIFFSIARSIR